MRIFTATIFAAAAAVSAFEASFTVHTDSARASISPYIYGTNQVLNEADGYTALRSGGNRLTGYNWENNASSAGADWNHSSDGYLSDSGIPGLVATDFHDYALSLGAYSLVTLQMAGYVAKDKNGTVSEGETAPSARWVEAVPAKGSAFSLQPDLSDNSVYMDEFVNFLRDRYGSASDPNGVRGYSLDNEPALWPGTHPRIHPAATGAGELISRSAALARAVKAVDPAAEIFGPALYGFAAYTTFQGAPDWAAEGAGYDWFISYYLDAMRQAETEAGRRLLDVLDIHWYSEARGDNRIVMAGGALTDNDIRARVQAPRTFWDPGYYENSWIGDWGKDFLPLLPKLRESIDTYYPGTKLAVTEWNFGGGGHVSGGIAAADMLGIFGKYGVYYGAMWQMDEVSDYISAAFRIFRNYDGAGAQFGSIGVPASTNDQAGSSIYAAFTETTDALHIMVINKSMTDNMDAAFHITSGAQYASGEVWSFGEGGSEIANTGTIPGITGNAFSYTFPPASVSHLVLSGSGGSEVPGRADMPAQNRLPEFSVMHRPGSHTAELRLSVSGQSTLSLDVCDVNGNRVKSVFTGKTFGKGRYSLPVSFEDSRRGIHLWELKTDRGFRAGVKSVF